MAHVVSKLHFCKVIEKKKLQMTGRKRFAAVKEKENVLKGTANYARGKKYNPLNMKIKLLDIKSE